VEGADAALAQAAVADGRPYGRLDRPRRGFGDLSYVNRTFRRRYGVTPSGAREPTPG